MTFKSGVYLGEALIQNPSHPVEKISFKNVNLGEDGLLRIVEAARTNRNIKKLHLGYVSTRGLTLLASALRQECHLEKLKFQEAPARAWTAASKKCFVDSLKVNQSLTKVKFDVVDDEEEANKDFKKEVKFYVKRIKRNLKTVEETEERQKACTE
jgi:hypothetical protein